jgi:glycosyltransferase involved in cell wall biosynthesis
VKICQVNLAASYRGGERQTDLLLRELAQRGWQQRLIGRHGSELLARCADVEGVELVEASSYLAAGRATAGCDLTHAHEARGVYASLYGSWFNHIPFLVTRRVVRRQKKSWFRDRAYRAAGAVAAVSKAVAMHVKETYPDLEPIVVPDAHSDLPVDAEFSTALREKYAGKVLILHIGAYAHSHKGQFTIIEAAKRASTEHPDWHFLLLGDGEDRAAFEEAIGSLSNIELTGFVDNVGDYLAASDVFVFPSLHEALGSSLLDALQFGLPIVATRVGGIPEFVEDGVNGTLIEPEAPDQLLDGIAKYAVDSPAVTAMRLANRSKATQFSAARMADAYEEIYKRIIPRRTPSP